MARKQGERSQRRRREMLAAYYEVLQDEGLQGASVGKIAKRLDVHPSLIIHYFGTKEQMTIELVDHLLAVYYETYGDKLAAIEDPLERLLAILDTFFSLRYQQLLDASVFYACFYLSLRHPKVRQAFAELHEAELRLVEAAITDCMVVGYMAPGDAHELAVAVKGMEAGFAFLIESSTDDDARQAIGDSLKGHVLLLLGLVEKLRPPASSRT
jgi:AcrR family transcriptional regulator